MSSAGECRGKVGERPWGEGRWDSGAGHRRAPVPARPVPAWRSRGRPEVRSRHRGADRRGGCHCPTAPIGATAAGAVAGPGALLAGQPRSGGCLRASALCRSGGATKCSEGHRTACAEETLRPVRSQPLPWAGTPPAR